MKVLQIRLLAGMFLVLVALQSCTKEEGEGGTSTIRGKVIVHNFDAGFQESQPREIYGAADQRVYIIYGADGTTYDDDFDTSYDGTYEFKYLQEGTYKLFVYSVDSTGAKQTQIIPEREIPVMVTVKVESNGSTVEVPDIIILDNEAQ